MMYRTPAVCVATTLLAALAGCAEPPREEEIVQSTGGIPPVTTATDGSSGESGEVASTGEEDKVDLPDGGPGFDPSACVEGDFDYIWIANSGWDQLSKIHTRDAVELARYTSGPGETPDPSRTSVNLEGDVAVANRREGGVSKFAASLDRCIDRNNNGTIETSQGPDDVLPWGEDECMLWNYPLPGMFWEGATGGPRALAWDANAQPTPDGGCWHEPRLWVGWLSLQDPTVGVIVRLDGATGEELDRLELPDWQGFFGHGPYGGAVDDRGGFWAVDTGSGLAHIDADTLEVRRWYSDLDATFYGIAIDDNGKVWLAGHGGSLYTFDPSSETFEIAAFMGDYPGGSTRLRGLAIDRERQVWVAANNPCQLVQFDIDSDSVVNHAIPLPGCGQPVGISIDNEGMVWVVDQDGDRAYRVDPTTYETVTVENLVGPYTYSDMTGGGLRLVADPPVG